MPQSAPGAARWDTGGPSRTAHRAAPQAVSDQGVRLKGWPPRTLAANEAQPAGCACPQIGPSSAGAPRRWRRGGEPATAGRLQGHDGEEGLPHHDLAIDGDLDVPGVGAFAAAPGELAVLAR